MLSFDSFVRSILNYSHLLLFVFILLSMVLCGSVCICAHTCGRTLCIHLHMVVYFVMDNQLYEYYY